MQDMCQSLHNKLTPMGVKPLSQVRYLLLRPLLFGINHFLPYKPGALHPVASAPLKH
jgi:hypothetical protein